MLMKLKLVLMTLLLRVFKKLDYSNIKFLRYTCMRDDMFFK
jgi:hypothetical protein